MTSEVAPAPAGHGTAAPAGDEGGAAGDGTARAGAGDGTARAGAGDGTARAGAGDGTGVAPVGQRRRDVSWEDPLASAALAADMTGLDFLRAIAEGRIPPPPIAALLGMDIVDVQPGQVTFSLDIGEHLYNPIGSVHGGIFCTLLDSAMGCAVHSILDRGQAYTTLELKVNLVKALTTNTPRVGATGQVISAGRRVVTASGQITRPDGTLYGHATTTVLILEPRPSGGKQAPARAEGNGDGR
jgi:uncharacterized protein (TIGR00369 family)